MMIVTRKVLQKPNNSKSPGGTHYIAIGSAACTTKFEATKEQIGSGWATAEVAEGAAEIEVAATYLVSNGKRKERIVATANVMVTGNQEDSVVLASVYSERATLKVEFRGVKRIEPSLGESE